MSASTIPRPTENAAIGRCPNPPRLHPDQIRFDLAIAKDRLDRLGEHLLGGLLSRALDPRGAQR
jgi:hypothetical protein